FFRDGNDFTRAAASEGPVDWDGDGVADNPHAQDPFLFVFSVSPASRSAGRDDWSGLFTGDDHSDQVGQYPDHRPKLRELSFKEAMDRHILVAPRSVQMSVQPLCALPLKPIAPAQGGSVTVALFGASDLDVAQIEQSSLSLRGANPTSTTVTDLNGDGFVD